MENADLVPAFFCFVTKSCIYITEPCRKNGRCSADGRRYDKKKLYMRNY